MRCFFLLTLHFYGVPVRVPVFDLAMSYLNEYSFSICLTGISLSKFLLLLLFCFAFGFCFVILFCFGDFFSLCMVGVFSHLFA